MIHTAGELDGEGVQRCTRCGYILSDNRGAMVPVGDDRGWSRWEEGRNIGVEGRFPISFWVTDDPADCEVMQ